MLALEFDGTAAILRDDYPDPQPARSEALVAVRMAGVCRTDLEILKGYMNFRGVMGHEFVGTVLEGPRKWKGKRVVAEINCVCGKCRLCRTGLHNHCINRTVLGINGRDGAFAEYIVVPLANLHEVSDGIRDAEAVFVEPLAAAFQLVRQVKFDRSDKVVVLGAGRLGQLIARVLRQIGLAPLLVGKHPGKLEAADKVSIQTVLVDDYVPQQHADIVVDATGSISGLEMAMRSVRPRGTIILKSTITSDRGVDLTPLVINEIKVVGSRCGPFPEALAALESKEVDVSALISMELPLHHGLEALSAAADGTHLKVLMGMH